MDFRIEKTYKLLINGFTELMQEKRYDEISVQELCEKSMVRRPTFYRHFADKSEFFSFYAKSMRDEFANSTRKNQISDGAEWGIYMLQQLLGFIDNNKKLVENVITSNNSSILIDMLGDVIKNDLIVAFEKNTEPRKAKSRYYSNYYVATYLSGGIISMVREWMARGQKQEDIDVMTETYRAFCKAI